MDLLGPSEKEQAAEPAEETGQTKKRWKDLAGDPETDHYLFLDDHNGNDIGHDKEGPQ
jgi:hypothetical protein